jgi:ankyrin repeat protein
MPHAVKDKDGDTPLHNGMLNKAPAAVIKLFVEACPAAAKVKNKDGRTPLHYGMQNKAPVEVLVLLSSTPFETCSSYLHQGPRLNVAEFAAWFDANNDGEWVKEKDRYGKTLLQFGMVNKAPAEVIKLLVEACPQAVKVKDWHDNTPLHNGMRYKAPAEVT